MTIVEDAAVWPDAFWFAGPIPPDELREWCRHHDLTIPGELFDLWALTGGGEIFETESILQPLANSGGDGVLEVNSYFRSERELPHTYLIFHMGLTTTAVHLERQLYVRLDLNGFQELETYYSLEEWYVVLRSIYADRYGMT